MLTPETLPEVQRALADAGVDGWLLYDFRGLNPIAAGLLRLEGMTSRRAFALIPTRGTPVALTHAIEQGPWRHWPAEWTKEIYSSWNSLEGFLSRHLAGKRVAMEYSAGDAVPYLDRIPAGVLEMVRAAGADVVSSGELVSRFYATWNAAHIESHERAAEEIAALAKQAADRGARTDGVDPGTVSKGEPVDGPRPECLGRRECGEPALRAVGGRAAPDSRRRHSAHRPLGARRRHAAIRRSDLDG